MRSRSKNLLIIILCVFMVCLITSTSTTTVAAAPWGTLKAGDEIEWKQWSNTGFETVKMKILELNDKKIKVEMKKPGSTVIRVSYSYSNLLAPWIIPQEDLSSQTKTYEFEGNKYNANYYKHEYIDEIGQHENEYWWDSNTGILFEIRYNEGVYTELTSTTADLAEAGGGFCLGTLLITVVLVTVIISYNLVGIKKR